MNTQILSNMMGAMGRGGDTMIAHLSHGDVVIPRDIVLQNPEFLTKFKKAMQDNQADYRSHIAGSGYESHNPETGAPEFLFSGWGHWWHKTKANPLPMIAGTLLAPATGGASLLGAAAYTGFTPQAKNPNDAMPSSDLGKVEQPFTPKRGDEPTKPFDLFSRDVGGQAFGSLDPTQQRSYLATQGSQGGGLGDGDKNYYLGLLKRNLIDESGQLGNMNSALLPIERNYLSRLGLPTDNTTEFFQALQS